MTLKEFDACVDEAKRRTNATLGHAFVGVARIQCAHCGRSDKAETRCPREGRTLMMRVAEILMERGVISPEGLGA